MKTLVFKPRNGRDDYERLTNLLDQLLCEGGGRIEYPNNVVNAAQAISAALSPAAGATPIDRMPQRIGALDHQPENSRRRMDPVRLPPPDRPGNPDKIAAVRRNVSHLGRPA